MDEWCEGLVASARSVFYAFNDNSKSITIQRMSGEGSKDEFKGAVLTAAQKAFNVVQ